MEWRLWIRRKRSKIRLRSTKLVSPIYPVSIISNVFNSAFFVSPLQALTYYPQFESDKSFSYNHGSGIGVSGEKFSFVLLLLSVFHIIRSGNRPMKRLFVMISLNVAYSTAELFIGLLTGRVGLVSDAFHLAFGCGLLTFSFFAMATSWRIIYVWVPKTGSSSSFH